MENLLKIDQKPGNMNDNQEEKNELKPLSQDPLLERKSISRINSFLRSKENIPIELTWRSIRAHVMKKKESTKQILTNVSGNAKPYRLTAIMGPSGSGKTTLLNLLSGRLFSKGIKVTGELYMNGHLIENINKFSEKSAYVMQDDILLATLTPRESFDFVAKIRLQLDKEKRRETIENIIKDLGLQKCADTMIGNEMIRGISGGERKRTSIGVELLTNPSLLFLDEPTTGLDSTTAYNVIQILKNIASLGRNVITTIHQPSSLIFSSFDHLILICEGKIIYQGEGKKSVEYFSSIGLKCGIKENPGDFYTKLMSPGGLEIEKMKASAEIEANVENMNENFDVLLNKMVYEHEKSQLTQNLGITEKQMNIDILTKKSRSSNLQQFYILCQRNLKNIIRNPLEMLTKTIQGLSLGIFGIIIGFYLGDDLTGIQNRLGVLFFFTLCFVNGGIMSSLTSC